MPLNQDPVGFESHQDLAGWYVTYETNKTWLIKRSYVSDNIIVVGDYLTDEFIVYIHLSITCTYSDWKGNVNSTLVVLHYW